MIVSTDSEFQTLVRRAKEVWAVARAECEIAQHTIRETRGLLAEIRRTNRLDEHGERATGHDWGEFKGFGSLGNT